MLSKYTHVVALVIMTGLVACEPHADELPTGSAGTAAQDSTPAPSGVAGQTAPAYSFDRPSASFDMPEVLTEISGLTVLPDGRLAAVQDEDGKIFILSAETGRLEEERTFGDPDDYEGIEAAGDRLFVLRSNGNLFEVSGEGQAPSVREIESEILKRENDTEGIAYDAANNRLLVVAKEEPGADLDKDRHRAIYAFDLGSGGYQPEPAFVIDLDAVDRMAPRDGNFRPSSVALHPQSGEVYVLSSVKKVIAVLTPDGTLKTVWALPENLFEQPEGLAFLPNGDLFVSSEGVDGPGKVYRYNR